MGIWLISDTAVAGYQLGRAVSSNVIGYVRGQRERIYLLGTYPASLTYVAFVFLGFLAAVSIEAKTPMAAVEGSIHSSHRPGD
jgi:hypothetical protein